MRANYLDTLNKENCCGCSACKNICPTNAITMKEDDDGFIYPSLSEDLCVNCGACARVCPIENVNCKLPSHAYAAVNKDEDILKISSSGGVFNALAQAVLNIGGSVCGAVINNNKVFHIVSSDKCDIYSMSGSKYVQSNTENIFADIKALVKQGKKVLFTGTPCQCAAMKSFFGNNENLFTMDFVCHGVPSQKMFDEYIEYLSKKENSSIEFKAFRHKDKKYFGEVEVYQTDDGKIHKHRWYESLYLSAFMKGLLFRDSCFSCNFSQKNRSSDITVCDYWGYENHHNQFAPKKGISAILINTEKGEDLFNQARAYLELEESGVDKIASGNGNLKASSSKPANREKFLADRKMFEYEQLGKSYMKCEKLLVYKAKQMIPGCVKDMIKNIRRKLR